MGPIELVPQVTVAALGAFAGVLLTITIQLLTSFLQRRADRTLRTYETKLEIFTDFLALLKGVSKMVDYLNKVNADDELLRYFAAKKKASQAEAIVESIERELRAEPPPSPSVAALVRERAKDEAQQFQDAADLVTQMTPRMAAFADEVEGKNKAFDELRTELTRVGFKLRIVTDDKQIARSLEHLLERIRAREVITPSDYTNFVTAAAKQVGIR